MLYSISLLLVWLQWIKLLSTVVWQISRDMFTSYPYFVPPPFPSPLWLLKVCFLYLWICFFCICIHFYYFFDSTYKRYHTAFVFLCHFTKHNILGVHLHCLNKQKSILFMSEEYFIYICTYIYIHIHTQHIFIHSSVDGHLGYFNVSAIMLLWSLGCIYLFK